MLNAKMLDALNKQINEELFSAYLYFAMAADFESKDLFGITQWLKVQAKEETNHALKIYGYINEQQGKAMLQAIPQPPAAWNTALAAFEAAYKHEQHITSCINALVKQARETEDYATEIFLQWFINEQVEEEANAATIVNKLKMIGESAQGLFMLDHELGKRAE
jgi:ferritin